MHGQCGRTANKVASFPTASQNDGLCLALDGLRAALRILTQDAHPLVQLQPEQPDPLIRGRIEQAEKHDKTMRGLCVAAHPIH